MREAIELREPTFMYHAQPLEVMYIQHLAHLRHRPQRMSAGQPVRMAIHDYRVKRNGLRGRTLPRKDNLTDRVPNEAAKYNHAYGRWRWKPLT